MIPGMIIEIGDQRVEHKSAEEFARDIARIEVSPCNCATQCHNCKVRALRIYLTGESAGREYARTAQRFQHHPVLINEQAVFRPHISFVADGIQLQVVLFK
jgi:hypothetical protein